jgi:hypothetical protein
VDLARHRGQAGGCLRQAQDRGKPDADGQAGERHDRLHRLSVLPAVF